MKITSRAFKEGEKIPALYTCKGQNISPPLQFAGVPENTRSLVLIMDDPDVPRDLYPTGIYDHWVLFNIPPDTRVLEEGRVTLGIHGANSGGKNIYTGPCPPDREHRYFFKLYALNKMIDLPEGATKEQVQDAMQGHIIAECELMGLFTLQKKG